MDTSRGETYYFYTLARGETHESMGSFSGDLDRKLGFDSYRASDDYYNLIIYTSNNNNDFLTLVSLSATPYVKTTQPGLVKK